MGTAATKIYEPDEGPFDVFYVPRAGGAGEVVQPGPGGLSLSTREIPVLEEMTRAKSETRHVGRSMAPWAIPIGCKATK